jgi:hypothetical protein
MASKDLEKTTSSRSCRWYTTTKRQTHIPRTMSSVRLAGHIFFQIEVIFEKQLLIGIHWLAEGEFHVDLYTLPDNLIKMLWDFTQEKGAL